MIPAPPTPPPPPALQLRLVDRSRREKGLARCARERWLSSAFTNGYGIRRKVEALPLATGSVIHEGLKPILDYAQARGGVPSDGQIIEMAKGPFDVYIAKGRKKIIDFGVEDDTAYQLQMQEQLALGRGLIYAWAKTQLPWVLSQQRIVQVEQEDVYVVGCTCGLTDGFGTPEQHDARGCAGIGYMQRGDFFTTPPSADSLVYHDFKSTGWLNEGWREGWRYKIQVAASGMAASIKFGRPVTHVLIHGLYKGKRGRDYNPETGKYDLGAYRQQSDLTYCNYKSGNPPFYEETWQIEKPTGKGAKTDWTKRGTWEFPGGTWAYLAQLPVHVLQAQTILAGPFEVSPRMLDHYLTSLVPDERRWQTLEHQLYEMLTREANGDWTSPKFQRLLDQLVPQSFDCYRFGKPCDMLKICHHHEGWERPLENGFELRRPHHEPELLQMRARGLEPPMDEEVSEDDE